MKPPSKPCAASAMILALLLIVVMGMLTAGWVVLISARSGMVGQFELASQRRIALENSRALAQEFMLENVLPSASGTTGIPFTYSVGGNPTWGGIDVPAWSGAPLLSIQKATGVNHFNPGNGDGYTTPDLEITLHDGDTDPRRTYLIKSRSPLLAGALLVSQKPAAPISIGSLAVGGRAVVWEPSLSMNFTAASLSGPAAAGGAAFTSATMSNLVFPCQIANPRRDITSSIYDGQFDTINNPNSGANSSENKATDPVTVTSTPDTRDGVTWDAAGNVTVNLNTPELQRVHIPASVAITTLTLQGQAAANDTAAAGLPSLIIVINQPSGSANLAVTLAPHNSRRLDLVVKRASGNIGIQFSTGGASWRMLLELENSPVAFTGTATITGGIRSDRTIAISSGAISLAAETDPKFLDQLATRTAWVESYQ